MPSKTFKVFLQFSYRSRRFYVSLKSERSLLPKHLPFLPLTTPVVTPPALCTTHWSSLHDFYDNSFLRRFIILTLTYHKVIRYRVHFMSVGSEKERERETNFSGETPTSLVKIFCDVFMEPALQMSMSKSKPEHDVFPINREIERKTPNWMRKINIETTLTKSHEGRKMLIRLKRAETWTHNEFMIDGRQSKCAQFFVGWTPLIEFQQFNSKWTFGPQIVDSSHELIWSVFGSGRFRSHVWQHGKTSLSLIHSHCLIKDEEIPRDILLVYFSLWLCRVCLPIDSLFNQISLIFHMFFFRKHTTLENRWINNKQALTLSSLLLWLRSLVEKGNNKKWRREKSFDEKTFLLLLFTSFPLNSLFMFLMKCHFSDTIDIIYHSFIGKSEGKWK